MRLGLLALAGYAAWAFLSIIWADARGDAWDGANRVVLYVAVVALIGWWQLRPVAATLLLAGVGATIATIGLVELLRANGAADPGAFLIDLRFAEPAGYMNANVAVWSLGMWPCLFLASARATPALPRALALGAATLLAALALLGVSRGWLYTLPVVVVVALIVSPQRLRLTGCLVAVGVAVAAIGNTLLAVREDYTPERLDALFASATRATLAAAAVMALVGLGWGLLERRPELARVRRKLPRMPRVEPLVAGVLAAIVIGGGIIAATDGRPTGWLSDRWSEFKDPALAPHGSTARIGSLGSGRYDFWRVAVNEFAEAPVHGIGIENFQQDYLRSGRTIEQPRYAHSLPIGALAQTGLIGFMLLVIAIGALITAAVGAVRRAVDPHARLVAAAALTAAAGWLAHASVDWFWEFAGLTGPALALLALAATLAPRRRPGTPARGVWARVHWPRARAASIVAGVGTTVVLAALIVSLIAPWVAERDVLAAARSWATAPRESDTALRRASDLNPLSPRPHLIAGTIALRRGDRAAAEREFAAALEREPRNAYANLELGAIASGRGETARARLHLGRAAELNPRDEIYIEARDEVEDGKRVDVDEINAAIYERAQELGH